MNIRLITLVTIATIPTVIFSMQQPPAPAAPSQAAANQAVPVIDTAAANQINQAQLLQQLKDAATGLQKMKQVVDQVNKQKNTKAKVNALMQQHDEIQAGVTLMLEGIEALAQVEQAAEPRIIAAYVKLKDWVAEIEKAETARSQAANTGQPSSASSCFGKLLCAKPAAQK